MLENRLIEWLKSMEGLATTLVAVGAAFVALFAWVQGILLNAAESVGLQKNAAQLGVMAGAILLMLPPLWFLVRSYRNFSKASRLEQPARFELVASSPEGLIGRTSDLEKLHDCVLKNRLVLLDGESGCGKSALVAAGLIPRLMSTDTGFIPVLVREWGSDWVRGPLATALHALFDVLTSEQRSAVGWTSFPDLAAESPILLAELTERLGSVKVKLGRRPLLIADQFDDYQARNREQFVDGDGNWLKAEALASTNLFWELVGAMVRNGALHLLVVTRADAASGLSCVRFVDTVMTADRHLPRVDLEYLRPLLEGIAPLGAEPPVVSRPDHGWLELREELEADLRLQGAVLMQQVRTVLLGLRQLPVLTVASYHRFGGLRGSEALFISRAIERTSLSISGGESGKVLARRVLSALVQPGGANQPAKAQRASFQALSELVGEGQKTKKMLQELQAEGVVRPADGLPTESAWQLGHDYLAQAVLAEARRADKWGTALHDGLLRYRLARSTLRDKWAALLSSGLQARLAWECIRGRLQYGEAAGFARLSLLKPLLVSLLVASACIGLYRWSADQRLDNDAAAIYGAFGRADEHDGVLRAWRAPRSVQDRIYQRVMEDDRLRESAIRSSWPLAYAGMDSARIHQAVQDARRRLLLENDTQVAKVFAQGYITLAGRLSEPMSIQQESAAMLKRVVREPGSHNQLYPGLKAAYLAVATKLEDPIVIQEHLVGLRERSLTEANAYLAFDFVEAYGVLADKPMDPVFVKQESELLLMRLLDEKDGKLLVRLARVYAAIAAKRSDASAIARDSTLLHQRLLSETDVDRAHGFAIAYSAVAAKLTEASVINRDSSALRERLSGESNPELAARLMWAYSSVVPKASEPLAEMDIGLVRAGLFGELGGFYKQRYLAVAENLSQSAIDVEATLLKKKVNNMNAVEIATNEHISEAYIALLQKCSELSAEQHAASLRKELGSRLFDKYFDHKYNILLRAYNAAAARLSGPSASLEAAALREQFRKNRTSDGGVVSIEIVDLSEAYAAVAERLSDLSVRQEAATLGDYFVREGNALIASRLAYAYAVVAAKISDPAIAKHAAGLIHDRMVTTANIKHTEKFSKAYAIVAAAVLEDKIQKKDASGIAEEVRQVLVLAGHPYLPNATSLLTALRPVAKRDFGRDVGAAVTWWKTTFRGEPATLRPSEVATPY